MKTIAIISALVAATLAAPTASPLFHLKTSSSDPRFNNKCIEAYHTGAGTDDAVLTPCNNNNKVYSMNGTRIEAHIFQGAPAGVYAQVGISYDSWYPVTIDAGNGNSGFKYSDTDGFTVGGSGFLACNWAHAGSPQLFILAYTKTAHPLLSNCGDVKLFKN